MRNMKKQNEKGQRKIEDEKYDLSAGEINQLLEIAQEGIIRDGLYNAVTTAFYAGVNVGHKIATAEASQGEVSYMMDGRKVFGCPYCGTYENGDIIPDLKQLISVRSKVESMSPDVELDGADEVDASVNYIVAVYGNELSLGFYSFDNAIYGSRKIRYCPMCGRKL